MQNICIETDATTVEAAILGDEYRLSAMGGIITEIKHLMSSDFVSCRVSICNRVCNKVAHALATVGCSFTSSLSAT